MTKRQWARYVRVSDVGDREGDSFLSPELQVQAMDTRINALDGRKGPVFEDLDMTGRHFDREGIQAAISWAMERPRERGLATYEVSRLGRNVRESLRVVDELDEAGADFASAQENIDLRTPEGRFQLQLFMSMAELFSRQRGRQWRETHRWRISQGLPHAGNVALGYRKDGRAVIPDAGIRDEVVDVFEQYARGVTLKRVAARLTEVRGVHVSTQNAKRTLRSRFYRGEVKYLDEWYPARHEPIISRRLWDRVQFRLDQEAGQAAAYADPRSPWLGLLRCPGCGGTTTGVNRRRGKGSLACSQFRKRFAHERSCKGIGTPPLEQIEELAVVTLLEAGRAVVRQPARVNNVARRVRTLERNVASLRQGVERLTGAYVRGAMTDKAFDAEMGRQETKLADAERVLAGARVEAGVVPEDEAARKERIWDVMALLIPEEDGGFSTSEARTMLREFIKAVYVHWAGPAEPFARWDGWLEIDWR